MKVKRRNKMITQARLKELYHYNLITGMFTRIKKGGIQSTGIVPYLIKSPMTNKYLNIQIDGKYYGAHQLAWLYVHGYWPERDLDHDDGIKYHNMIANLLPCTRSYNVKKGKLRSDNKSGVKGVNWNKSKKKWCVWISTNNAGSAWVGQSSDFMEAVYLRLAAEQCLGGNYGFTAQTYLKEVMS